MNNKTQTAEQYQELLTNKKGNNKSLKELFEESRNEIINYNSNEKLEDIALTLKKCNKKACTSYYKNSSQNCLRLHKKANYCLKSKKQCATTP